ncbi:MAG: 23S rRNA (uracil(1939)-C(5))-methyltransferase RlmD [Cellulosilyticaceae bacterium]
MAKKLDIIEGTIDELVFPNKGILYIEEGEPVVITGAFEGQKVRARLAKKRKGRWEARLLEVLENPPYFVKPVCQYFGVCGGCTMQEIPYEVQLDYKHKQVQKLLSNAEITGYEDAGIVASPEQMGYRNKMEFSFGDEYKEGPLALGMHRKQSTFDIVTVDGCKIVDEDFSKILRHVLAHVTENALPFYKKVQHEGYMRFLIVRKSKTNGEMLVNIVTSTQQTFDFAPLAKELANLDTMGKVTGVLHTLSDTLADAVKPDSTEIIYGVDYLKERLLDLDFHISPFSFFQTNTLGAEVLYSTALDMIKDMNNKTIFDLYCGTGTITQIMATRAQKVYGIEIVEEAVDKAKENAKLNNLDNCYFIAGDVLTEVDKLKDKPDIIVLDPPREGIHPKAIQKIINFDAKELLYISCKPTSLARDLPILEEAGYKVEKVCCVDMFPNTPHVETVVHLTRTNGTK